MTIEQIRYYDKRGEVVVEDFFIGGLLTKRTVNGVEVTPVPELNVQFFSDVHIIERLTIEELKEKYPDIKL